MEEVGVGRRNRQTDVTSNMVVWQYFKTGRSQKFTFVVDWELCIGHALCIWSVILDTAVSFIGVRHFIHRMLVLSAYIICCFFFVWLRISCQWIDQLAWNFAQWSVKLPYVFSHFGDDTPNGGPKNKNILASLRHWISLTTKCCKWSQLLSYVNKWPWNWVTKRLVWCWPFKWPCCPI